MRSDDFIQVVMGLLIVLTLTALGFATFSDGRVDYCYIQHNWYAIPSANGQTAGNSVYTLHGHRPWRPDAELGRFASFKETTDSAESLHCSIVGK